jgi:hypothetical protein
MNKDQLFAFFQQQDPPVLLEFLDVAFEAMSTNQREAVFGQAIRKAKPLHVDGPSLLEEVQQCQRDSRAGKYYAPFEIKGKIIPAYLASLAATSTPEEYAAAALPLIRRDSYESFTSKTYAAAIRAADQAQRKHLKAEIARLQVRIRPEARH